jgi:hypothetical protein
MHLLYWAAAAVVVGLLTGFFWWLRLRNTNQGTERIDIDTTQLEQQAHIDAAIYSGAPNRFASLQSWGGWFVPRSSTHQHNTNHRK